MVTSIHKVYIGLGSNISPEEYLLRGIMMLSKELPIEAVSSVWETPPVGGQGGDFLNAVVSVNTSKSIDDLRIKILRPIENRLGRVRTNDPYSPRTLDLDILIYNHQLIDESLWDMAHICVPLSEIYPDYTHPESGICLKDIAARMRMTTPIRLRHDIRLDQKKLPG
jgi:2-amino-4-hydroxy-6-hydroxymethyldihydropteridine diphosphokinase